MRRVAAVAGAAACAAATVALFSAAAQPVNQPSPSVSAPANLNSIEKRPRTRQQGSSDANAIRSRISDSAGRIRSRSFDAPLILHGVEIRNGDRVIGGVHVPTIRNGVTIPKVRNGEVVMPPIRDGSMQTPRTRMVTGEVVDTQSRGIGAFTTIGQAAITPNTPAPENPFYLVVAITYKEWDGASNICTGTLLGPRHVLTAGHCACGQPDTYKIVMGNDATGQPKNFIELKSAPVLFDQQACLSRSPIAGRDLALLLLNEPFYCDLVAVVQERVLGEGRKSAATATTGLTDCRSPAARVRADAPARTFGYPPERFWDVQARLHKGMRLTAAGHGFTETGAVGVLMKADIPIVSIACTEPELAPYCVPFGEMFLAESRGASKRPDTCRGDSGGPIFLIEKNRYTLVAVTSRAGPGIHDPVLHCGGGGIYTIVGRNSVRDWFEAHGVEASRTITTIASGMAN